MASAISAALRPNSLQKDLKILAALSLSLSSVVGQNASLPMRFVSLFTGAPSLSAQAQTLSNPFLLWVLVVPQEGSMPFAFCMPGNVYTHTQPDEKRYESKRFICFVMTWRDGKTLAGSSHPFVRNCVAGHPAVPVGGGYATVIVAW